MGKRRILSVLTGLVLIFCLSTTASAHEAPDLNREGRITITLRDGENAVSGGSLTCTRVGEVAENDGDYSFVLSNAFQDSGISLEEPDSWETARELADYAAEEGLYGTTERIGEDGRVLFDGLEPGLYLMTQKEAAEGYEKLSPFLVSLPVYEDGIYRYAVDASPKISLERAPTKPPESTQPTDSQLPQTGTLNWPVPALAASGLALLLLGWYLCFGKKDAAAE